MCSQSESYKIRSAKPELNSSSLKNVTHLFGLPLANDSIQLRTLYEMIVSAPKDAQQVTSEDWRKQSYLYNLLEGAERLASKHPEWKFLANYWMLERPALASKTR